MIGIIGAMDEEVAKVKEEMTDVTITTVAGMDFYEGKLSGRDAVVVRSGIGKVNAAVATALVVQHFAPDCVVNTGSAGGLGQGLRVGDVVIGEAVAHHDVDVTAFGYAIGQVPQLPARFESAPTLIAVAAEAAAAFEGAAVHRGLIVSGDQFVHSSDKVAQIRRDFAGVQVVEMEAAAIAQACAQLEVPFVVVRAVSDLADEKADVSFETFLETASVHSAQMVRSIIEAL